MEETNDITFIDIYRILKNNISTILISTLVGLVLAALVTFLVMEPKYSATTDLVVNDSQNTEEQLTQSTLQTNLTLLNTYQSIIEKPIILDQAIADTGTDLTIADLQEMVTVSTENDSLVFSINVESDSPYLAADLANAIAGQFAEEITNIMNVTNVTVLTVAEPNVNPVSPRALLNLAIGTLVGAFIGVGLALLRSLFDRSVRSADIITELGWVQLGSVPEMSRSDIKQTRFHQQISSVSQEKRRRV